MPAKPFISSQIAVRHRDHSILPPLPSVGLRVVLEMMLFLCVAA
jgi:hypothetical protein